MGILKEELKVFLTLKVKNNFFAQIIISKILSSVSQKQLIETT